MKLPRFTCVLRRTAHDASPVFHPGPRLAHRVRRRSGGRHAARRRGVAEEFNVLPSGLDVGAQLRSINADGGLGMGSLKLTDLALFDMQAQWAFRSHYELDGSVSVVPKQPSSTSEPVFQGGGLT